MADRLRFHPQVASDLKNAVAWYDAIDPILGDRFRLRVNEKFDSIEHHAESFPIVVKSARAAMVQGFPYLLLFESAADYSFVIGLFHTASDPRKWKARQR